MKRSILILVSALFAQILIAQDVALLEDADFETKLVNTPKAITYVSINANQSSKIVKDLQESANNFDVKLSDVYDNSEKAIYTVTFKRNQGQIIATYNNEGILLSTKEHYKNIKLPLKIRRELIQKHPDWEMAENTFRLNYKNSNIETKYTVVLKRGHKKRTLNF